VLLLLSLLYLETAAGTPVLCVTVVIYCFINFWSVVQIARISIFYNSNCEFCIFHIFKLPINEYDISLVSNKLLGIFRLFFGAI
jgi:hypothetical protein